MHAYPDIPYVANLLTNLHCLWQVLTAILPLIVIASVIGDQFEAGTNSTVCHPLSLSALVLYYPRSF